MNNFIQAIQKYEEVKGRQAVVELIITYLKSITEENGTIKGLDVKRISDILKSSIQVK